jgi:shikimate kinase
MPAPHDLPRNIALIGFMGSGKTTVGRALAERLGYQFVDTDAAISQRADGRAVADLFAQEGEDRFREREADVLRAICGGERQVIATGGGVVVRQENVVRLRESALVIHLTARPDVVVARTRRTARSRPLLAAAAQEGEEALLARVLDLLSQRAPHYLQAAHLTVDSSDYAPAAIAGEIHRKAERWFASMLEAA